jgi:hypothetical protein
LRIFTDVATVSPGYRPVMDYAHFTTAFFAARHVRLRVIAMSFTALGRLASWARQARSKPPVFDRMTDEIERAMAGERPDSPFHRYRYRG